MANDLTQNPLIVDTAGAGNLIDFGIFIKNIEWVGGTTAGHVAEVQDINGNVLWRDVAAGANHVSRQMLEKVWPNGFKVPTLGSGTLYITYI